MKLEVLYLAGCPHREGTVERIHEVIAALGVDAEVSEVEVRDAADAARLRFPGSPTVRIDGADVEPGADARAADALSCRIYGGSGVPPRELLVEAIGGAPNRQGHSRWLAVAGIPMAGLAALPACPACYPLYAGILSSLGLSLDPSAHSGVTASLLAVALAPLGLRARAYRRYGPLVLGLAAGLLVVAGKLLLGSDLPVYAGAVALAASCLWSLWPSSRAASRCVACTPDEPTQ